MQTQSRSFAHDEIIFHEGDTGDCAYLIEHGRVLIYLDKSGTEVPLRTLGEGEVFGEMSLIDNNPRSASCRAQGETRLIMVTKDQLLDRIHSADPVVRLLMRALLERLRSQNEAIAGKRSQAPIVTDSLEREKKEAVARIGLENRLFNALKNDEFVPYYQPIYDLRSRAMKGCEALIRWISPEGEIVSPAVFMDVVEESALVIQVGQAIIDKCLRDLPAMRKAFPESSDFFCSVNISGRQFADPKFLDVLEGLRQKHNVYAPHVKLEVTERVMMEGPAAFATLQDCQTMGYKLAIDDFGTGFSSLQYLASMPLNDLKIDRSFVMKMLNDAKSLSVVKSLIHLAHQMGLGVIAEGIETPQELQALKDMGVACGQGFYFSKGLPLAEFIRLPSGYPDKKTGAA